MSRASARAIKDFYDRVHKASWHVPPDDHENMTHRKVDVPETYKNPTTGRNTKLGRRVEKPADPNAGGPSGQKDKSRHNKRHTNK